MQSDCVTLAPRPWLRGEEMPCLTGLHFSGEVQSPDVFGSEVWSDCIYLYVVGVDSRLECLEGRCKCRLQTGVRRLPFSWPRSLGTSKSSPPALCLAWLWRWHGPSAATETVFSLLPFLWRSHCGLSTRWPPASRVLAAACYGSECVSGPRE